MVSKIYRVKNISDAEEFATHWYEERLLEKKEFKKLGGEIFIACAAKIQEPQETNS